MKKPSFISCNEGVALVEFGVVLPFLLIMFLGMLEMANYTLQHQKIDKVANSMADFVTQSSSVSTNDLTTFGLAVPQIMRPFAFDGTVIFTSVSRNSSNSSLSPACNASVACINWQYRILGTDSTHVGSAGVPTLPNGYTLSSNQNIIIAEAFLHYSPILSISGNIVPAFTPETIYKVAVFKPRQGSLLTLN